MRAFSSVVFCLPGHASAFFALPCARFLPCLMEHAHQCFGALPAGARESFCMHAAIFSFSAGFVPALVLPHAPPHRRRKCCRLTRCCLTRCCRTRRRRSRLTRCDLAHLCRTLALRVHLSAAANNSVMRRMTASLCHGLASDVEWGKNASGAVLQVNAVASGEENASREENDFYFSSL
jgi:hypothetical protein